MNARQKAKKYKKLVELYKDKAEAYDRHARADAFRRQYERESYGTIETIKICKYFDDRLPEEYIKNDVAKSIAEYCLENGLIKFKKEEKREPFLEYKRVIGTMYVCKKWGDTDAEELKK